MKPWLFNPARILAVHDVAQESKSEILEAFRCDSKCKISNDLMVIESFTFN